MEAILEGIIIYARDMHKTAEFYRKFFNFFTTGEVVDGVITLEPASGGASIRVLQAARRERKAGAGWCETQFCSAGCGRV